MSAWDRGTPWRQGNLVAATDFKVLGLTKSDASGDEAIVVISHDCDLVQPLNIEPNIEVMRGRFIDRSALNGNFTHAKNPRRLHIPATGGSRPAFIELTAVDRALVSKELVSGLKPVTDTCFIYDELTILQCWLAARYRRAAFSDTFEQRLRVTRMPERLSKILSPVGEHVVAVFFNVDDGEDVQREAPEDVFCLDVYLLYSTQVDPAAAQHAATEACQQIRRVFAEACCPDGKTWRLIELRDCEIISDEVDPGFGTG
jgi:hypothetical protein